VNSLLQDIRFAGRSLRKQPGLTGIAILCLALGIGANTAIFSVVRTVLLGALPYHDPGRLTRVAETFTAQGKTGLQGSVSVPNFTDWRLQNRSFEGLAAYNVGNKNLLSGDEPERVRVVEVTANTMEVLGARTIAGRTFRPDEDQPGQPPAVILSEGFWRRRFGGRRDVLESSIKLDSTTYTVVGVMPASFDVPISPVHTDAWTPLVFANNSDSKSRGSHWLSVVGRLRAGTTFTAAESEMKAIAVRLLAEYPNDMAGRGAMMRPLREVVVGSVRPALLMLLGAVGLVLLIACANVANLLLARASGRRREVAIRTALGADSRRIVRQFLTESLLLALAGGALGIAVAYGALRAILTLATDSLPLASAIGLDPYVLGFTTAVSVLTGLGFGLVPAWQASRPDLRQDLSDSSGKASISGGRHRLLKSLVVAEIALSLVLLAGAGLLLRSFGTLLRTDPGLETRNVLTFHARVALGPFPDSTPYVRFYGPVLARLRALPGVRAAGMTNMLPIQQVGMNGSIGIVGRPAEPDQAKRPFAEFRVVSSGFFKALGIPVRAGREFEDGDAPGAEPVILINQEFARRYFPNENAIGKQLSAWSPVNYTIVGVVGDVKQAGLDQDARAEIYVNAAFNPYRLGNMTFVVSTLGKPELITGAVREAVRAVSPGQPIFAIRSMEQVIGDSLRSRELTLVLLAALAALAVGLAAAGIYGVMAYTVTQRTRELGIRMALGASGRDVTMMVLGDAATLAGIGVGIGLVAAVGLSSLMTKLLFGVGARDPATLLVACLVLPTIAIGASFVPAMRAARADPLTAIRSE
jgi:predicted permease